jgi:hypothetical protein
MGRQVIDWIGALVVLRALFVVLCLALVRWALAQFAPKQRDDARPRHSRIRRGCTRRRGASRKASLDSSST